MSLADLIDDCLTGADCLFDPELHDGPADAVEMPTEREARELVAKEVCASCPALDDCKVYTARIAPKSGIWAGTTPAERSAVDYSADGALNLGKVA
ncbi:WhiB family transcriptional regulator [Actinomadura nitritigenes]|uniref:WhiB family transcriptional regulator n=1 Tax=Actinomadura nitritigenes TaxID=134602 RepID=UPI0036B151E6